MVAWKLSSLLLLSLRALNAFAAVEAETAEEVVQDAQSANLKVTITPKFPQSEIFGVKLINGHATQAVLDVKNEEPNPISVAIIGGSILADAPNSPVLRNLTAARYSTQIPAGESESITYSFTTEMHPQSVRLQLVAVLQDQKNAFHTFAAYNETVSVVEAPTSFLDPQIIFLYIVLLGVFIGTVYFIYNTWLSTFLPQQRRGGKGGERAKRSSTGLKKVDPAEQVPVVGGDGPAVATGIKSYDETWIPAAHLQRPEAKRIRSGTPKTKVKG